MLSSWDALGVPPIGVPISISTLVWYILPPTVFSFVMAVLAITPHSRLVRVALWPIVALLALRAVASVDMSLGRPGGKMMHGFFVVFMFGIATRTLDWALEEGPLVRHLRPANSSPSIIMDALDLCTNSRGLGWNWSNGLYVPQETRPKNRLAFAFYALLSAVMHTFINCVSYQAILLFTSAGSDSNGFTVFDQSLPLFVQCLRAGIMTALMGIVAYASMQVSYDLGTMAGVLFLRQDPVQWPPAFDAPWRATSLSDFWGRRWHQSHRRMFLFLGGYPLSVLLGRTGIVLGAFLVSAVLHDLLLASADNKSEAWWMFAAFGMMAPGILAERGFSRLTGKRVGGVVGWVWTMTWLLLWNSMMFEGFARVEEIRDSNLFDSLVPVQALAERVVMVFDAWLRTI